MHEQEKSVMKSPVMWVYIEGHPVQSCQVTKQCSGAATGQAISSYTTLVHVAP